MSSPLAWSSLLLMSVVCGSHSLRGDEPLESGGAKTEWKGFARYDLALNHQGKTLKVAVVAPDKALPGRPWIWRGEFLGAFDDADVALIKKGWHLVYVSIPDQFGSPRAMAAWDQAYAELTGRYRLAAKPGLIGLSRGGLYCMNWAAAHPDRTLAVYLDNAVCDFKSWPGGAPKKLGTGKGSASEWAKLLQAYDFKSDEEAIAYKKNPIDDLKPAAAAKIPLLLVYADKDSGVPHAENSELVYERYRGLGGPVERIVKPGQDHHPHGLPDVTPIVEFFTTTWNAETKSKK